MTFTTLFSGIGGKCLGFKQAGLTPINHFEIDPRIAEIGQANSKGVYVVGDVCEQDWHRFEAPDVLAASPVCKNFSVANNGAKESDVDIATAKATVRALRAWRPKVFFLENVYGYRESEAFKLILEALKAERYNVAYWHLNSADYGVPQTRRRLVLVALRDFGGTIRRPPQTHEEHPKPRLFDSLERWNGWYQAIEDLLPTLPESKFADWQLKRLGDRIPSETFLQMTGCSSLHPGSGGTGVKLPHEPANTVATNSERMATALLVPGDNASNNTVLDGESRAFTVCSHSWKVAPRAFICEGSAAGEENKYTLPVRGSDEPVFTVRAGMHKLTTRAFIVDGQQTVPSKSGHRGDRELICRDGEQPLFTVPASVWKGTPTASLPTGRVVAMTPRALARFQSFPDDFELSGHRKTDCIGIGNAVPSLLVQRVAEHFLRYIT